MTRYNRQSQQERMRDRVATSTAERVLQSASGIVPGENIAADLVPARQTTTAKCQPPFSHGRETAGDFEVSAVMTPSCPHLV